MKFRKLVAVFMTATVITASLAGCGSTSETESTDAAEETAVEEETEAEDEAEAEEETEVAEEADAETEGEDSEAAADEWVIDPENMKAGTAFENLTADSEYDYQIIVKAFANTYYQALTTGAEQAAEDLGVKVTVQGPNNESDVADQINMLNAAINNKPDGIGLAPCDTEATYDSLTTALEAGVPIVASDSPITGAPEGTVAATVATDSIAAGGVAAQHCYDAVSYKLENAEAPIRIGMVAQDVISSNHTTRGLGFIDGIIDLAKADGYKVAVIGTDYFVENCSDAGDESDCDIIVECAIPALAQLDMCATECSAIIAKDDTVAIYTTGQTVSEGLVQANENLGVLGSDPETDVLGIAFDAGAILKEAIADGTLFGGITQLPTAIGYYTVCTMVAKSNGEDISDMTIPGYWYDASNMDSDLIAPNLYD